MNAPLTNEPAPHTRGRTLDHAAAVYDILAPMMTFWQEGRYRNKAIRLLDLKGPERILDIGCGTGVLTRQIAKKLSSPDALVVGLDAAPKMFQVARQKASALPHIRFDVGVAEKLDYEDVSFDGAVSTFFFHHIDADLKRRSLSELYRVLKPGAKLIIVDVDSPSNVFGKICAWSGYWLFKQNEILENIRGELRKALHEVPFREVSIISHHSGYITVFQVTK